MLELPDIELLRRFLSAETQGRRIESIRVADRHVLNGLSPRTLHARLAGTRLQAAWRKGAVVGVPTDGDWGLILHLSPGAEVVLASGPSNRYDRLEIELDKGVILRYRGGREKGSVGIAPRGDRPGGEGLGPDALTVGAAEFDELVAHRRGRLKNGLVDQSFVSGLGDVMADEILFKAKLHPHRTWPSLYPDERRRLWTALWATLREAIQAGPDYRRRKQWLASDRRAGRPCPKCGKALVSLPGRRTTIFCPADQPLARPVRTVVKRPEKVKAPTATELDQEPEPEPPPRPPEPPPPPPEPQPEPVPPPPLGLKRRRRTPRVL